MTTPSARWPELEYQAWRDTLQTLNRWVQIIGKIRLSKSPWTNHGWHSTLYLTEAGLSTSVIHEPEFSFSIELDLVSHSLRIRKSDGTTSQFSLASDPVAVFHERCVTSLRALGIEAKIFGQPNELPDSLPFAQDFVHRTYDAKAAHAFWQALRNSDRVMKVFRSQFVGKASPVHFFWGSMDIAVTRFSGKRAPEHPGGFPHLPDLIAQEAYSHEVSSCGFWPGNERFPTAAFYSYAYPQPKGFEEAKVPEGAFFHKGLREFILPYDVVRNARSSEDLLMDFFQKTYEAAANLGGWDRDSLEHSPYLELLQKKAA